MFVYVHGSVLTGRLHMVGSDLPGSLRWQMEHYKLDWHRFNLRQRLAGRAPAMAEEFERKTGAGETPTVGGRKLKKVVN